MSDYCLNNLKSENITICDSFGNQKTLLLGKIYPYDSDDEDYNLSDHDNFSNDYAYCETSFIDLFVKDDMRIYGKNIGKANGLPEPDEDELTNFYIVDDDVALTNSIYLGKERNDLFVTDKPIKFNGKKYYTHLIKYKANFKDESEIQLIANFNAKWVPQGFIFKKKPTIPIVNLAALDSLCIVDRYNHFRVFPSMGFAYCDVKLSSSYHIEDIPVFTKSFGGIIGLPEYDKTREIYYIVSFEVFQHCIGSRDDLLIADEPIDYGPMENSYGKLINKVTAYK